MTKSDELNASVFKLRSLCSNYPVRFTADISGLSYSTVNRFINGDNPKLSTITNLMEFVNEDKDLESKYLTWKRLNLRCKILNAKGYKFKIPNLYKGN